MTAGSLRRLRSVLAAGVVAAVTAALLPSLVLAPVAGAPGARDALFTPLPGYTARQSDDARVVPRRAAAYRIDLGRMAGALAAADVRPTVFSVPDPAGRMVQFRIQPARVMQAGLAARHPEIRTYAGTGITDPASTIRLDLTPMGFHASVIGGPGFRSWYVDPAENLRGTATHLSYLRSSVPAPERPFNETELDEAASAVEQAPVARAGGIVTKRTYRLALVTDPTYATYFGTANVLAEKVTLMNRVNQVYNNDLGVEMVLVNGTEKLNLDTTAKASGPNGLCGANPCYDAADLADGCTGTLLDRTEFVLGQIIGADKFDIGHIGLGINGGGIAGLGVVGEQYKADGCTGLPFPEGDFYAVDYVAHEMGHQFAGNHTFNGALENCSLTNRAAEASVEPGSGSSVMAYAGICGRDDLQPHSDPYFSQRSIDEITAHVTAAPFDYDEQQVVNLQGYDADGEQFQLTYPGKQPVTITRGLGGNYNALGIAQAVMQLTGVTPEVSGYDGASGTGTAGFTLDWSTFGAGTDIKTLGVTGVSAGVSGFVGTPYQGGPGTNRGFTATPSGNHAPVVTAPADKTIPVQTPFTLTGSGTDADGHTLTYLWEQNDEGLSPVSGSELLANGKTDGPLFRVFGTAAQVTDAGALQSPSPGQNLATTDPSRTFPDLAQVVSGVTNQATGSCPAPPAEPAAVPQSTIDCYSEFLPTAAYGDPVTGGELNFRVTARDGALTGGGTSHDDVTLTLDPGAGPFVVSSRAAAGPPADGGSQETVTWSVKGTNTAALAPNVKISLSTDGGVTFPRVLLASTPNDGSQAVTLPGVSTTRARIKVEAVGNYFFDVNGANFTISSPLSLTEVGARTATYSDELDAPVVVTASSEGVDGDQLTATIAGIEGLTVTRGSTSPDGARPGTAQFLVDGPVLAEPGARSATVTVTQPAVGANPAVQAESTFAVTVAAEAATVSWTGPTQVDASGDTAELPLSTTVTEVVDSTPGDLADATVTFVDRESGATLCTKRVTAGATAGSGSAACTAEVPWDGSATTYTVGTVVGGGYLRNNASDDTDVTVSPDTIAPDTQVTGGPAAGAFFLKAKATLRYAGSDDTVAYRCRLDGKSVACGDGAVTLRRLSTRAHVFTVAAVDEAGNVDPSPARRAFVSPYDDSQLDRKGDWSRERARSAYRGTYLETTDEGASLTRRADGVRQIALVVGTHPGAGRLAVYFRGRLLGMVSLSSGSPQGRVLMPVADFNRPRSGLVRVVAVDDRPTRVEGLGLR